jgi:hypothetical protein
MIPHHFRFSDREHERVSVGVDPPEAHFVTGFRTEYGVFPPYKYLRTVNLSTPP